MPILHFKTEINSKINQTITEALVRVGGMLGASVWARRLSVGQSNRETNNDGGHVRSSAVAVMVTRPCPPRLDLQVRLCFLLCASRTQGLGRFPVVVDCSVLFLSLSHPVVCG